MKKLLSIALLCTLLLSLVVIPSAAAEKKNVMTIEDETWLLVDALPSGWNHVPERMFDGVIDHNPDDSASFCNCVTVGGPEIVFDGTVQRYDIDGIEADDGRYLQVFQFEFEEVHTVDSFKLYVDSSTLPLVYCNVDGVEILLSETGAPDSWKTVFSGSKMLCGGQYKSTDTTNYIEASFEPTKAQYVAIGVTEPRCLHEEELFARYPGVPQITTRPDYFGFVEFELYEYDPAAATTTVAPETTTTPETTTVAPETTTVAPETTTVAPDTTTVAPDTTTAPTATTVAPTQTPDTADILPIACVALMLAAAACLALRKKFN